MIRRLLNKIETIYKYRYFSRVDKGAYQFLLQKIYKSTDINFIEKVFQLDYFRELVVPKPMKLDQAKKVLILAPHQDDEVLGCGGSIYQLSKMGCELTIGFITDGAELSNPKESVNIRKKESENLCNAINALKVDFDISNISLDVTTEKMNQLVQEINKGWDIIYTVWPLDQPPKHRWCSYLIGKALERSTYKGNICFYAVHTDLIPNVYVDISENVQNKKDLIQHYASQLKHQNYEHLSSGLDAWRSRFLPVSSQARSIETFMMIPMKSYDDFQMIYKQVNIKELFKGNEICIDAFKKLNKLE